MADDERHYFIQDIDTTGMTCAHLQGFPPPLPPMTLGSVLLQRMWSGVQRKGQHQNQMFLDIGSWRWKITA